MTMITKFRLIKLFKKKPIIFKKKQTWAKIAKKYKDAPFFRIEDYGKYKELHLYQKSANEPVVYKMPLKIVDVLYISKFFPDDVDFFRKELIMKFNNMTS